MGAAMVSLSISTYLARCLSLVLLLLIPFSPLVLLPHIRICPLTSFWPKGELGGLPVIGLALGEYKLMPLWIWIYCLLWWFIQVGRCPAPS